MHITMETMIVDRLSIAADINYANNIRNRRRPLLTTKLPIQVQLKVLYMVLSGRTSSLVRYSCRNQYG